ncbi:4-alpha-glucanotransferase [Dermacoccaceae bacterium W4C1]
MPAAAQGSILSELATAHGVATEYWDWKGHQVKVSHDTLRAVLAALGVDAGDETRARAALKARRDRALQQTLPPVVVTREGSAGKVAVRLPADAEVTLALEVEEVPGSRSLSLPEQHQTHATGQGESWSEYSLTLPADLPLGYHVLRVAGDVSGACTVIVTPEKLELPSAVADHQAWGLTTQLYAVRSEQSWGLGDVADLAELGSWGGRQGADFVLVNPMHAAEPAGTMEPSPYLPVTRRFFNPMYIRVEEVPEMGYLSSAEHQMIEWHGDDARRLNGLADLDRDSSWEAKQAALRIVFRQRRTHRRRRDFEEFCAREGQGLIDYATWCAFVVEHGLTQKDWPTGLNDPTSKETEAERRRLAEEVEFHSWMQWIVQQQLADCQRELRAAGMSIGVLHDLAVGVHPGGSDAWSLADVLATGMSVGAPPDDYNVSGQDWSQPPWRPDRLAEMAYQPYRDMLRTVLRVAGGLRVDHILGLFRLWWVPQGRSAKQGTYVRYDHEAMVGILALEAHRANAIVIGEDLGTVEDWVRDYLTERGVLGTSILWFERQDGGAPRPPESYRHLCLASVTTHDLPPTAGYLQGEHIRVRSELGLLPGSFEQESAADEKSRDQVLADLRTRGLLTKDAGVEEQVRALYRYLRFSPAALLGVAVPDLVGDERTINQPGTDEEYPNWRLPLADPAGEPLMLEDLMVSRRAKRLLKAVSARQPQD